MAQAAGTVQDFLTTQTPGLAAALTDLFDNGPVEVGVAAGMDYITDSATKLPLNGPIDEFVAQLPFWDKLTVRCKSFVAYSAMFIRRVEQQGYKVYEPSATVATCAVANNVLLGNDVENYLLTHGQDVALASLTIVFACKINWWQMNHHTGTSMTNAAGYTAKAITKHDMSPEDQNTVRAVWTVSHWFDTKHILTVIGILKAADTFRTPFPKVSSDIILRRTAMPAGTARIGVLKAMCDRLASSVFGYMFEASEAKEYEELQISYATVQKDAPRFHLGSKYLTGHSRYILPEPTESFADKIVSIYITVFSASTLAKSPIVKRYTISNEEQTRAAAVMRGVRSADVYQEIQEGKRTNHFGIAKASPVVARDLNDLKTE